MWTASYRSFGTGLRPPPLQAVVGRDLATSTQIPQLHGPTEVEPLDGKVAVGIIRCCEKEW